MKKSKILVVDDEEGMLEVYVDTLQDLEGVEICPEKDSRKAAERLAEESFDVLITDIRMPGIDGVELLRIGRKYDPELPVLIITAFPSVETAVEAMKLGAVDYITKPFLPDDLLLTVRRLIRERRLNEENRLLRRQIERPFGFDEIIGKSPAMQKIFDTIKQIAPTNADVLIVGETGTGKELVARSIHRNSSRRNNRFVPVDCGAIPENLLESEFFGYERGAFTGAVTRNIGLLEFTDGGTFFLDEVGELPLHLQAKLLRVLQERKVRRLGGKEEIPVDVRIIAATSRDLKKEVEKGHFREDLYFRINVIQIELPPLRERDTDVLLLAEHFISRYAPESGKELYGLSEEAKKALLNYPWPGNVRELQNAIRRGIAVTCSQQLQLEDLPPHIAEFAKEEQRPTSPNQKKLGFFQMRELKIAEFEREYLIERLKETKGDVTAASKIAQIPRGTFYRLLKKYQIDPKKFRSQKKRA